MGEDRWAGLGTVVAMIVGLTVVAGLLAIDRADSDDHRPVRDREREPEESVVDDEPPEGEAEDDDVVVEDPPDELWTAHEDETVRRVVTDGEVVCATGDEELFCVDADGGEDVFRTELPGPPTPVVLAGDTLVVAADGGDGNGDVYAYSLSGELLWQAVEIDDLDVEWSRPLAVAGDTVAVVAGTYSHSLLVGLDAHTGAERWRSQEVPPEAGFSDTGLYGSVFSDGSRFYAPVLEPYGNDSQRAVVALDPVSGAELWRLSEYDEGVYDLYGLALMDDDLAFLLVDPWDGLALAVDPTTGAVQWEYRVSDERDEATVAAADQVVVLSQGEDLVGVDTTGTEIWRTDTSDLTIQALVTQDGEIYGVGTEVSTIDPDTGETRVVYDGGGRDVVVAGDVLVVGGSGLTAIPVPD